ERKVVKKHCNFSLLVVGQWILVGCVFVSGRRQFVELFIKLESCDAFLTVENAFSAMCGIVSKIATPRPDKILHAHGKRVTAHSSEYSYAVEIFLWPLEELCNVANLVPGSRDSQVVAILGLKRLLFA